MGDDIAAPLSPRGRGGAKHLGARLRPRKAAGDHVCGRVIKIIAAQTTECKSWAFAKYLNISEPQLPHCQKGQSQALPHRAGGRTKLINTSRLECYPTLRKN